MDADHFFGGISVSRYGVDPTLGDGFPVESNCASGGLAGNFDSPASARWPHHRRDTSLSSAPRGTVLRVESLSSGGIHKPIHAGRLGRVNSYGRLSGKERVGRGIRDRT